MSTGAGSFFTARRFICGIVELVAGPPNLGSSFSFFFSLGVWWSGALKMRTEFQMCIWLSCIFGKGSVIPHRTRLAVLHIGALLFCLLVVLHQHTSAGTCHAAATSAPRYDDKTMLCCCIDQGATLKLFITTSKGVTQERLGRVFPRWQDAVRSIELVRLLR